MATLAQVLFNYINYIAASQSKDGAFSKSSMSRTIVLLFSPIHYVGTWNLLFGYK